MMTGFRIKKSPAGNIFFFRVSISLCAKKEVDTIQMRGELETNSAPGYPKSFRKEAPAP